MQCSVCGQDHPVDELELTYRRPDEAAAMSEEERAEKVQENLDLCVIEESRFFVRGLLPLSVVGRDRPYNLGIWVEISQADFEVVYALWDDPEQSKHSPMAAAIANDIHGLPATSGLAAALQLTGPTTRPEIHVLESSHALYCEQHQGITEHRAHEYSRYCA